MKYKFKSKVWIWGFDGAAAWHFVTVEPEMSEEISKKFHKFKKGFGSLKVKGKVDKCVFDTSIFPNRKDKNYFTYFLPLKKSVRKEVGVQDGDVVEVVLEIFKT